MNLSITCNDKTIWLNGKNKCFARFCPSTQEYLKSKDSFCFDTKIHPKTGPTKNDWENFRIEVFVRFEFNIPKNFVPQYLAD